MDSARARTRGASGTAPALRRVLVIIGGGGVDPAGARARGPATPLPAASSSSSAGAARIWLELRGGGRGSHRPRPPPSAPAVEPLGAADHAHVTRAEGGEEAGAGRDGEGGGTSAGGVACGV